MRTVKSGLLFALALLAAQPAFAHGRGGHVGVYVGPTWGFYSPFYFPPPIVVLPPEPPPVYIEQYEPPPEQASSYWYYCAGAKAYYPYVKECPGGWQKIPPQPSR